ncbi:hypothetical protein [Corynebacterium propinquum]
MDVDELVYHPNLREYLDDCDKEGYDVVVPTGFDMAAPTNERNAMSAGGPLSRRGIPNAFYSKSVIFSTRRIEKVDFGPGAHTAQFSPEPRVKGNQIGY